MFIRKLLTFLIVVLSAGCASNTPPNNGTTSDDLTTFGIRLHTDFFVYNYRINENDQVTERISLYDGPMGMGNIITLDERQGVVKGAYARLAAAGSWADNVRAEPVRDDYDYREYFNQDFRPTYNVPALDVLVYPRASGTGTHSVALPIPTQNEPQLGLEPEWTPEREWIAQMVGQFIDIVGEPQLNPEDHLYRFSKEDREWLPIKLNFNDYR